MLLNKAKQLLDQGRMNETLEVCQEMLSLEPGNFDAIFLLGKTAGKMGQHELAESFLRAALSMRQGSMEVLNDLANVLAGQKKFDQALEFFLQVHKLGPESPEASVNVATVLYDTGKLDESMQFCAEALRLNPDFVPALVRKGMILYRQDDIRGAIECHDRAYRLDPDNIEILNLLAVYMITLGRHDEALPFVNRILQLDPDHSFATSLLQNDINNNLTDKAPRKEALFNAGLIDQAEEMAREELEREDSVENHNFLLKCYLASSRHDADDYFRESREWSRRHGHEELLPQPGEFKNNRNPDRRLRVGIVGDYFLSVIGSFTLYPFFLLYDRKKLEVFCYNFGPDGDDLRPVVDHYRDISKLSGDEFFKLVRKDVIDIMLDINGRIRTPNYFETLLRQPAPIQVNWYNLPCTVGTKAFNYAITDEYCVRKGEESAYVEKIFRMPTGTICAWHTGEPPVVPPPPVTRNGHITFGCFGDFFKVNAGVLETWAKILDRVPGSRLYLKSNNLRLRAERDRVSGFFEQRGIAPDRLDMEGMSPYNIMKRCYEWMDIGLDTFPYSSGSTTINAIRQGVPVIAINGNDWRGRSTAAVLAGAGLEEFVAPDVDGYIDKAAALAGDPARLAELRATLGRHMAASPQWDVKSFVRNFEKTLRGIWQDWLKTTATNKERR